MCIRDRPFVVPAAGDLQQSAYKFHRGPRAGRTDVPVLVLYGLESMPTDFFRIDVYKRQHGSTGVSLCGVSLGIPHL